MSGKYTAYLGGAISVAIAAASSGDNTAVAAVTGKKIVVIAYTIVAAGAVTVKWQSGATGTDLSGAMSLAANGILPVPVNENGWVESAAGVLLNIRLGGAVAIAGHLTYILV